jgi:hypothetical protein
MKILSKVRLVLSVVGLSIAAVVPTVMTAPTADAAGVIRAVQSVACPGFYRDAAGTFRPRTVKTGCVVSAGSAQWGRLSTCSYRVVAGRTILNGCYQERNCPVAYEVAGRLVNFATAGGCYFKVR